MLNKVGSNFVFEITASSYWVRFVSCRCIKRKTHLPRACHLDTATKLNVNGNHFAISWSILKEWWETSNVKVNLMYQHFV